MGAGRWRRGSMSSSLIVGLAASLGITAMAVDLGLAELAQGELQNSLDAGALAGAGYLDSTAAGVTRAADGAREFVQINPAFGRQVRVDLVETGVGDAAHPEAFVPSTDPARVNAVRVSGSLQGVTTPFGALYGHRFLAPSAWAVAVRPSHRPLVRSTP